jgi:hypothetical protein
MNHSQIISEYGDSVHGYVEYHIFLDGELDKAEEAEMAFEFYINNIKDRYDTYTLVFLYHPMSYRNKYLRNYGNNLYDAHDEEEYEKGRLLNKLVLRNDKKMDTVSDLMNLYDR